ncbi:MAG TPA: CPBP family intramembrane glutamic endopeptidase [Bryobacteraceae bacterium]|nr:CPBP family intramembrane glutamic endopeptidase [Bryobacteraceae bacterium]
MRPRGWRSFLITCAVGWAVLASAGAGYAIFKHLPAGLALPLTAAFLIEYTFFLVPGFEGLREWISDRIPPRTIAAGLALSALLPYLVYSLGSGEFRVIPAARLAALVLALSFWYILRKPSPTADLALLALVAAAVVARFFKQIYTSPNPSVDILSALGKLMLIRLYAGVMLILREVEGTGYGFLPTANEWRIGLRYYLYYLPVGAALFFGLGLAHFRTSPTLLAVAPLYFLGVLWGLALGEEFLARGLLQKWISDWTGNPPLGLILASIAFGASHLWFRDFPNWRWAITATALGWFCGKAFNQGGGIRAAMVTHALVVTTWQTLLS